MDKNLAKLLARLTALKTNVPQKGYGVPKKYVDEFNSILKGLGETSGEDLNEFMVPTGEVKPRMTSIDMSGRKTYSSESYCDREFISMKIDSVLGYFTLLLKPTEIQNKLGFDVEEND